MAGESASVSVASFFSDPNGDALTYTAASSNTAVATVSVSGGTATIQAVAEGTATVTVTARDPGGLSASQTMSVVVAPANAAPEVVGTIPALTVEAGFTDSVHVSFYFNDPDGDPLDYSAASSNEQVGTAELSGSVVVLTAVARGTAMVMVTARDPGGLEAAQSFEVVVEQINRGPEAVGMITPRGVRVGESTSLDVSSYFRDPDGDALAYTATTGAASVATASASGGVVTVSGVAPGVSLVTVTARDAGGLDATQEFRVAVDVVNRAPKAEGTIPTHRLVVGETGFLNIRSYLTDPDGDALTYAVSTSAIGVARVSVSGGLLTIFGVAEGPATVTVTARDPGGLEATQRFEVTVRPPNRAPEPEGMIPAQTVSEGGTITVDAASYFSEPDGEQLSYAVASSNARVATALVTGSAVTITAVARGTAQVTVTARDPGGLVASQQAWVTVSAVNQPPAPVGTIPAQTVASARTVWVSVHAHFRDPDGDQLEYTVVTSDAGVATATAAGSVVTVTGISRGTATITVTGRDRAGLGVTQAFGVTVPNGSPRAEGTIPEQTLGAGETATVDVSSYFSDPDGDALTYVVASGNENVVTASLSGSTLTVTAVARGFTSVTVTARDPEGLEATQRAWVTVAEGNQAPVASGTIADRTIDPGRRSFVNLFAYFSDPDFDALSYEAATSNPAVVTVSVSGSTAWLEAVARGTATVTVTASDPDGLEATQQFMVEVANGAPEAVGSIADSTINVGETFTVDLSSYFTDPDGDQLAYEAEAFFDRVATVSVSGSVMTIVGEGRGSTSITVTARDPDGEEARQRTRVEVIQPNRPPEVSDDIPDQTVDQHRTAWFLAFAYFRDPDFDRLAYAAVSSNEGVATVEVSRSTVRIAGVEPGTATVTVTATDPDGLEASQQVGVTVNRVNRSPEAVGTIPDRSLNVDESFTVDVAPYFTDPDGDRLEYEGDAFFDNVASVSMSGSVMTVTALSDFAGGTTVTVTARDPDGEEARQRTRVDVIQPNRPPEVRAEIPDQTVDERDTERLLLFSYFEDPDRDRLEYSASSADRSVATVEVSGSRATITGVTPGMATITVTARDPGGLEASQEVRVTVERVNRDPEAMGSIPEQTVNVGESVTVDVAPYFSDPDDDPLTYEADVFFDNRASATMSGSLMTITGLDDGSTSITVTATDPDGEDARQRTRVTVEAVNRPPEAVGSIPAESITVGETERVFVRSYFSDPDRDRLEYSVASSNAGVAMATVSGTVVSITGVAEGNATVTVTASDPDGLTATQEIGVSVGSVNQWPETVGTIPEQTVNVGSRVTVDVARYFRDPDGDDLEYEAETFFTNRATVSMSGSVMTIRGVSAGNTSLTVTASDPDGLEARQRTRVTVQAVNGAPQAVGSIPSQTIAEGRSVTVQTHSYFRDPDGDRLSYRVATSRASVATASVTSSGVVTISSVAAGSATVTVTASDPSGLEARQTIGVTVTSSNSQPRTRGSIPGQTLDVGATATVDVSSYFSDPDQDALSYGASTSNARVATASMSGSTVTITGVASGTATITVTARDPGGLEATQTMDVGVAGTNEAPETVGSIPNQTIDEGESTTIDASSYFRDPDDNRLRYSATSADGSTATVSVSGSTVTIEGVARGTTTITVTASDPEGLRARQQASVTVRAVNRAPVTSGTISDRTVDVGDTDELEASSYFHDPDSDRLTYRATSSNTGVARASASGSTVTIMGVARGTATITVTARDPGGLEATQSAMVSVSSVNEAPAAVGAIPAQSLDAGRQVSLRVTSYFNDPDADPLEYEVATSNDAVAMATAAGGTVTITGATEGNAMVTVTARDPSGLTATQRANVAVGAVNQWPEATGTIPDQTVKAGATEQVDLSSYFRDPDGDNLDYAASSFSDAVATVSVSGSTMTISGVAAGNTQITVTAEDPDGLDATHRTRVTVEPDNLAPEGVGTIPAETVTAGATGTVDVSSYFTDPDGDALTYRVANSNANVVRASVSGSSVTITGVGAGTGTITVTARDPRGLEATQELWVTVEAVNRAPETRGTIPAQTVEVGAMATVNVSSYFSDPDGNTLGYTAATSDGSVATVSISGAVVTIAGVAKGTATLTITAADPDGLEATQTITVTVPNRSPETRGTVPAQTVGAGATTTVNVSSSFDDPDGDALGYTAASSDATVATASASSSDVTISGVARGIATVTVTARDPVGLEATQQISVSVERTNQPPVAVNTIPSQVLSQSFGFPVRISLANYFSDPDGDSLRYSFSSSNASIVTALQSPVGTVAIIPQELGIATVTVTARDPGGLEATQQFGVTVVSNRAPEAVGSIPDSAVSVGETLRVDPRPYFTDPDANTLEYSATTSDQSILSVSQGGETLVTGVSPGTATVTVLARDLDGLEASQAFQVTVESLLSIVTDSLPPAHVRIPYTARLEVTGGSGTDYTWSLDNASRLPPGLELEEDGTIHGIINEGQGQYEFGVRVRDSALSGARATLSMRLCANWVGIGNEGQNRVFDPPELEECGFQLQWTEGGSYLRVTFVETSAERSAIHDVELTVEGSGQASQPIVAQAAAQGRFPLQEVMSRAARAEMLEREAATAAVHARLRQQEEGLLRRLVAGRRLEVLPDRSREATQAGHDQGRAGSAPEEYEFRIPLQGSYPHCTSFRRVTANLIAENDDIVVYGYDTSVPVEFVQRTIDFYSDYGAETIDRYFGGPGDVDENGTVTVLVRPDALEGADAYVWAFDRLSSNSCAASNVMDLMHVDAATFMRMNDSDYGVLTTVVHEMKHLSSHLNRLLNFLDRDQEGDIFHPKWIEEGTADIAKEAVSRLAWERAGGPAMTDRVTGQELLAALRGTEIAEAWGVLQVMSRTVLAFSPDPNAVVFEPYEDGNVYGSGWHFHRFLRDWNGDAGTSRDADETFMRTLNSSETVPGVAGIEAVTGLSIETLLEEHALAMALAGSGASRFATYDFPTVTEIFANPDPPGIYPWPVTTTGNSDATAVMAAPLATAGTRSFKGRLASSGIRVHDFRASGQSDAAVFYVDVPASVKVIVARIPDPDPPNW